MAEKIAPSSIPASEKGDLYYSIGISASQCWDTDMAYKYTDLALKTYQQEFIPKRIVECHMNMGVTHNRLGNYKTSLEHYINALKIGKKLEIDILRFTTEYNVGYSYFQNQKFDSAITHLEIALEYVPKEYTADTLLSYSYLIMSELELNNYSKAQFWAIKGNELITLKHLNINSPTNNVFKIAYMQFMSLYFYIFKENENFKKMVTNHLIPSLKNMNFFYELGYFNNLLGNVYYDSGDFEESSKALKEAQKAYRNLVLIR
jgi:tetratricopeptide (TPR) repeat protein